MTRWFPQISACSLLVAITAFGQTDSSTLEVLPHSSESFLLTPASPSASLPIVIDRVPRADIMVTALSQDLEITVLSPKGTRYSIGQKRPDFESFVSVVEGLGANYRAVLRDPLPGTWTLQVTARKLSADLDVVVNTLLQSEIFLSLVAADIEHRVGDSPALSVAVFEGATRLRGVQIAATVIAPNGSSAAPVFRDDGGGADFTANDGIYSAFAPLPQEGEYEIRAEVRGVAAAGQFHRTASARLRARRQSASLTGTITDAAVDDDSDGLFDAITVAPAVTVAEAGTYSVTVRLRSPGGKILQTTGRADLLPGSANPVVRFPAEGIRLSLAQDGPYSVDQVLLERRELKDIVFVDRRSEVGLTHAYRLQDLQRDRLRLTGPATAEGIDTNGNGLFDTLKVEIEFETEVPAAYWCSVVLSDPKGTRLGESNGEVTLVSGRNRLSYVFDGRQIADTAVDGTFEVAFNVYGPTSRLGGREYFTIGPFTISSFENVPDTTPPTILVTISPYELWPVDHKMVEVIPNLQVRDDRDPSPVVRLESVIVSEGANDLGDGNTSPDIRIENGRIWLRAERSGKSTIRYYRIKWSAKDRAGNNTEATAFVIVPHDQGH